MSNQAAPCLERIHTRPPAFPKQNKGGSAAYCSRKHPTYTISRPPIFLISFPSINQIFGFDPFKVKNGVDGVG